MIRRAFRRIASANMPYCNANHSLARRFSRTAYQNDFTRVDWGPEHSNVATVVLQGKPANTLSLESSKELRDTLRQLSQDKNCAGIILRSDLEGIFSAGLDLKEVMGDDMDRKHQFIRSVLELFVTGYTGVHKPMVAEIDGAAPAGGCMLALFADSRVVSRRSTIGLNEVQVGIPVPPWLALAMESCIGTRQAERHVMLGEVLSSSDALRVGLVDRITDTPENLRSAALDELQALMRMHPDPQHRSKLVYRSQVVKHLQAGLEREVDRMVRVLNDEGTRERVMAYVDGLRNKTKQG